MLVAPSAMGKTTIMSAAIELDRDFGYVRSFTTRAPRASDQFYWYVSKNEAYELRKNGKSLTYVEHPTTGDIYGTTLESYEAKYNLLDTLSSSIASYTSLSFAATHIISITTSPKIWREWFRQRYPEPTGEALKRLDEAKLSIQWSLAQTSAHAWVINDSTPHNAAQKLIGIAKGETDGDRSVPTARAILELLESEAMWL